MDNRQVASAVIQRLGIVNKPDEAEREYYWRLFMAWLEHLRQDWPHLKKSYDQLRYESHEIYGRLWRGEMTERECIDRGKGYRHRAEMARRKMAIGDAIENFVSHEATPENIEALLDALHAFDDLNRQSPPYTTHLWHWRKPTGYHDMVSRPMAAWRNRDK